MLKIRGSITPFDGRVIQLTQKLWIAGVSVLRSNLLYPKEAGSLANRLSFVCRQQQDALSECLLSNKLFLPDKY